MITPSANMVSGFGGSVASCDNFIRMIGGALSELQENLKNHNRTEQNRFTGDASIKFKRTQTCT